jgi:hypothetical protein
MNMSLRPIIDLPPPMAVRPKGVEKKTIRLLIYRGKRRKSIEENAKKNAGISGTAGRI